MSAPHKNGDKKINSLRIGGTSWVIEGSLADNLKYLAADVRDMEIVLFDTGKESNIPGHNEITELKALCSDLDMTCTVHFPVNVCESTDKLERVRCEDMCLRVTDIFAPLDPFAWIMHVTGEIRGRHPSRDMDRWACASMESAARIAGNISDRSRLCVENLDYEHTLVNDLVREQNLSMCLDIGHLIKYNYSVSECLERYLPITRVVHLHGVKPDGTDHVSLSHLDPEVLLEVAKKMDDGIERVLTMEVFNEDYDLSVSFLKSINVLL